MHRYDHGFDSDHGGVRVTLYRIGKTFWRRLRTNDTIEHAYGLAFNFTLAIFPAMIFIFTLIPYIPMPSLDSKIVSFLQELMPESVYEALKPTIEDTVRMQRGGLLSFGFFSTLYLATNGMMSLIKTFNLASKDAIQKRRGYFQQRAIATLLTLALTLALFCTILLLIVTRQVLDHMLKKSLIASRSQFKLIFSSRLFIVFFMFFITISAIYHLAPATRKPGAFVTLGSLLATIASLLVSLGFSYYVNNFSNYNRVYGSLGVMIALMVWLFLLSVALLVGFELNVSITKVLQEQPGKGYLNKTTTHPRVAKDVHASSRIGTAKFSDNYKQHSR